MTKIMGLFFSIIIFAVSTQAGGVSFNNNTNNVYFNKIVDNIYIIEGGAKAKSPYGILSVKVKNKLDARRVCYNTVRNNYVRWSKMGRPGAFLDYLADVYCPMSVDPIGNRNWKKNINQLMKTKISQKNLAPELVIK